MRGGGAWFYEVEVLTAGIMQIGWATKDSKFLNHEGYGIGDDDTSVAYDGCRQLLWHDAASRDVDGSGCGRWRPGDRIGSVLDLDRALVAFFHNGRRVAVSDDVFKRRRTGEEEEDVRKGRGFFAAASFMSFQQCRFNFGFSDFVYWPREWPPGKELGTPASAFKTFNGHGSLTKEERTIVPRLVGRDTSVKFDGET